jgi:hypothetical protein
MTSRPEDGRTADPRRPAGGGRAQPVYDPPRAAAGTGGRPEAVYDPPRAAGGTGGRPEAVYDPPRAAPGTGAAGRAEPVYDPPGAAPDQGTVPLFPPDQADSFRDRWADLQAQFIDDPPAAVRNSEALVAEVLQTLAASFTERQGALERTAGEMHTEALRQAFQRYRAFFHRLLSA